MTSIYEPTVSIVMPALNEAHVLPETLAAISHLDYARGKVEVIFVDNGSTDGSTDIARASGAIVLVRPTATIGELRNIGAERARGDVLAFVDSDCVVARDWLRRANSHLQDNSIGAVGSHTRVPQYATWVQRTLDFHYTREGVLDVTFLPSANLLLRRTTFEMVGGFHTGLVTGEDSDLSHRIRNAGLRLISDSRVLAVHLEYPPTLRALVRKEAWHSAELVRLLRSTGFKTEYVVGLMVPVAFALCLAFGGWALLQGAVLGQAGRVGLGLTVVAAVPLSMAIYKAYSRGKWHFIPRSTVYYSAVLFGRLVALMRAGRAALWDR